MRTIFSFGKVLITAVLVLLLIGCKKDQGGPLPSWYPETNEDGDPVSAIFESRIPCEDCERLKFSIVIYENAQTHLLTTYLMSRIYVGKSDERITNAGNITVSTGTSLDSLHIIYRLTSGAPAEYQSFWKIDEHLLFILDENLTPMVGDAGYGFVLNRIR